MSTPEVDRRAISKVTTPPHLYPAVGGVKMGCIDKSFAIDLYLH
jgi:hypothetical protein